MEALKITGEEYEKRFLPMPGFVLLRKDLPPQRTGVIYTPDKVRDDHARWAPTGIVRKKCVFNIYEDDYTESLYRIIKIGDRVGFSNTSPVYSPSPLFYQFEGDDKEAYIIIHVKDLINVIIDTREERIEFRKRAA